jgi:CheY-like chemotaxis protein
MSGPQHPDRRRHERGEVVARCEVFSASRHFGSYLVNDLSAGGACLIGEAPLLVGAPVRLLLQLPGRKPIGLAAKVVRRTANSARVQRFAVAFGALAAADEDAIHEALMVGLENARAQALARVLVFRGGDLPEGALERDLREAGCPSVAVGTPLEAVARLTGQQTFATALVDLAHAAAAGLDFLEFLGTEHPRIRRVVVGAAGSDFRATLAVRSGRAHVALARPWSREELLAAAACD